MSFRAPYWLVATSLALTACSNVPERYSPPEPHLAFRPHGISSQQFLAMGDPEVPKAIVRDIVVNESGPWRWTGPNPELRFQLPSSGDWTLVCEFVINDRTFRDTGPVAISFFVNDQLAGKETYTRHGDHTFEKRVPPAWIRPGKETRFRAEIHNAWRTPTGDLLGILLKRVGFVQ